VSQVGKSPPDALFGPLNGESTDQGSDHPWRSRGTRGRHHRSIVPVSLCMALWDSIRRATVGSWSRPA